MKSMLRAAALALACAAAPCAVGAQQGDTATITLERALEIARASNPAYRSAVNNVGLNGPETQATWSRDILPRLDINLSTGLSGNLQKQGIDPFGNPVANPAAEYVNSSNTRQGIGLSWTLRGPSVLTAKKRQDVVNADRVLLEEVAGQDLRIEVRRRFFDALEQEELLAAEQAVAEAARSDQETARRLYELGLKTRVDVLQAELQLEQRRLDVRQQTGRRDQARLALRTALGQEDLSPVKPAVTAAPVFDPADLDAEALVRRATEGSAPVRRQASALRQADVNVSLNRNSYWPTVQAGFTLGRFVQSRESASLFSFGALGDARYSNFFVEMRLPFVTDVLTNRSNITRAEILRENQRDALRQARLQAEEGARSALLRLQDRWEGLQIADRSLAIAQETVELAREEYRLGIRTFESLQLSVGSEAGTRRQQIQARYGFVDALMDLEAAVGEPVR